VAIYYKFVRFGLALAGPCRNPIHSSALCTLRVCFSRKLQGVAKRARCGLIASPCLSLLVRLSYLPETPDDDGPA
jgi:hypothetical protein